jgi:sarcosine oxidase subunit beta
MPVQQADVVVIGGGIVGASIVYHLAALRAGKIVLLERENLLGTGSTGRCAGGFRHQFSTEINIRLSLESVAMILRFAEELDCPQDMHQDGYLFLVTKPEDMDKFRRNVALQNRWSIPSQFLTPQEISLLAPHVCLDGVLGGSYCAWDGIGDPQGMTMGYAAGARRLGAEIMTGVTARGIRKESGRVAAVVTDAGSIACGAVVNAAGPHAREVARWAGVDLPVYPQRRHVYCTSPLPDAPRNYLMVIDFTTTFYFHRESGGILMGMGNAAEPSGGNLTVDPEFLDKVLEVALVRFPALADAHIHRSWAGLYEMSPDALPILGKVPQIEGFYLANGFSGHGFQHAPITGKLLAEEIVFGRTRTLDIDPLRLERFAAPTSTCENNVV